MIAPNYPQPNILFYAVLERVSAKKTPKYAIKAQAGDYPPMLELVGKDGLVSMYLLTSKDSGTTKDNAPAMKLQAKNSLNFTGLKDFFVSGKLNGFAYGYPLDKQTYSKDNKTNPFFEYKDDGFLFVVHCNPEATTEAEKLLPSKIELMVLEGAKVMVATYCKQLMMGGFDAQLDALRKLAKSTTLL